MTTRAADPSDSIPVTFFHRRPDGDGHFSIEAIFRDVRARLDGAVRARVAVASWPSIGLWRRLAICWEAWRRQGAVNHVTGDVNFVGLVLDPQRTVQTIHDLRHLERTRGLRRAILKLLWVTLPVRRAAVVTVVSEATRRELLRHVPSCDPARVVVIPNAISGAFRRADRTFRRERPRVLQVGTADNKNIPRLVEALRGTPCTLEVIGVRRPAYEALLREAGVEWEWRSGLTDAEVVAAYERADLVAFVSTYEGFGMPILEAQAVGRPVVAGDVLSMPEVAGEGACLVDPLDVGAIRAAILRIVGDDDYRGRLVAAGFENVRRYDPEVIAGQYLEVYRRVAARRG